VIQSATIEKSDVNVSYLKCVNFSFNFATSLPISSERQRHLLVNYFNKTEDLGTLYFVFFACYPPSPSAWGQILAMQKYSLSPCIIVVLRIMYTNQFQLWKSAGCFKWLGGVTPSCGSGLSGGSGFLAAAVVSYCGLHMLNHATLQINRLFNLICLPQFTWSYAILHCWMTFRQHGRWDCFLLLDTYFYAGLQYNNTYLSCGYMLYNSCVVESLAGCLDHSHFYNLEMKESSFTCRLLKGQWSRAKVEIILELFKTYKTFEVVMGEGWQVVDVER
jgi:hypothetical protein